MTPIEVAVKPPTNELGGVVQAFIGGAGNRFLGGVNGGASGLLDAYDPAPDWQWGKRVDTIDAMRRDAQVMGLELGMYSPIKRWKWSLDPNGAPDDVVQLVARSLGLPIVGAPKGTHLERTRGRFRWAEHLRLLLRAPSYGAAYFEQVATQEGDGTFRLRKLAPRPLRTITKVNVEADGGLLSIEQGASYGGIAGSKGATIVPVDRLVAYVWDQEPGSWSGSSMLRPLYKHFWLKQQLYKIDATKHDRYGAPMPIFEAPVDATDAQLESLNLLAQAIRSGARAGGAVPAGTKSHLIGASGTGTDVVGSVAMHDQAMARAWASMAINLAQNGEGGNRALGGTFADLLHQVQVSIAEWVCDVANAHVVEDLVDWNYRDPMPYVPRIVFEPDPDPALAVGDMVLAIDAGLLNVDHDLEAMFREKYRLPEAIIDPDAMQGDTFQYDLELGVIRIDERRARLGLDELPDGRGALTIPEFAALFSMEEARAVSGIEEPLEIDVPDDEVTVDPPGAPVAAGVRAGAPAARSGGPVYRAWAATGRRALLAAVRAAADTAGDDMLPDRSLRRQRTAIERQAATNFADLDAAWEDAVTTAVAAWADVRVEQQAAVVEAIIAADGDLIALANLEAPLLGVDIIEAAIRQGIIDGIDTGNAEAKAQGVTAAKPAVDDAIDDIATRAEAMATTFARAYGEVAGRYAMLAVSPGMSAEDTAASVVAKLEGRLTDAFIRDQLGAAVQGGQNAGRFAAFAEAGQGDETYYASEILDRNTCGPCMSIDGTKFADQAEAMDAYPLLGAYDLCEGGERCRGSVIAIMGDEADATIELGEDDDGFR